MELFVSDVSHTKRFFSFPFSETGLGSAKETNHKTPSVPNETNPAVVAGVLSDEEIINRPRQHLHFGVFVVKCFGLLDPVLRYSPEGSNCVYYTVAKPERRQVQLVLRHSRLGKPPVDRTARSAKGTVSPLEAQVLPHRPFACWDYYFPCPLNYEWSLITLDLCRLVESVASGKQQASHTPTRSPFS